MFEGSDCWGHDMIQFNCAVALCDILGTIRLSLEFMVQLYIHVLLFHIRRFNYLLLYPAVHDHKTSSLQKIKGNVSRNIYLQFHGYLHDSICNMYMIKGSLDEKLPSYELLKMLQIQ